MAGTIKINNDTFASTVDQKSTTLNSGTYHLADNPHLYEIQRTNNFVFHTSGLADIITISNNEMAELGADNVIQLAVSRASVPHFSQSAIQVKRGNNTMKFAGVPEFKSGSLTCVDYIGSGIKDVLMQWQAKSYDVETEKVGLAKDYKIPAYLIEYTPDYQVVRTWLLEGCWISELSEDEYNYDSNDKHTISVTIEYDKAKIDKSSLE